jgi:hypothetical protein
LGGFKRIKNRKIRSYLLNPPNPRSISAKGVEMQLREVLTAFEQGGSMSLSEMARRYDVDPAVLEDMIQFWVRKGRLRDACNAGGCGTCHQSGSCAATPMTTVTTQPHRYELLTDI